MAWTPASATSRPTTRMRPGAARAARRGARPRRRCSSPSTRTSRRAARRPYGRRRRPLPRKYCAHLRPVRGADRRPLAATHAPAGRQRHLPGDRARPDHHRQGGRERRPPLAAGGSSSASAPAGTARRWPTTAPTRGTRMTADARARRGDEGDLDAGRGQLPRRVRGLRPHLVVARSPPSGRTRRCWSAATARPCSTACSPSATRWFPNYGAATVHRADRGAARARADRPIDGAW